MGAETYIVDNTEVSYTILAVLFFSSLFIYNSSRLTLWIDHKNRNESLSAHIEGNTLSVFISSISIILLFGLLTACTWQQVLVFMITSFLSIIYMMPFKFGERRMVGLRNHLWLKNIILSLTWASATVLLPAAEENFNGSGSEFIFMFIRRFFFIYSLTVVYDFRDLKEDHKAGLKTIALQFGKNKTRLLSLAALALFILFALCDPYLHQEEMAPLLNALLISAFVCMGIILTTWKLHQKPYFAMYVDSAMIVQFTLVLAFSLF